MKTQTQTTLKILESLPENLRELALEKFFNILTELQDEYQWNKLYKTKKNSLRAHAKKAKNSSKTSAMDFSRL